MKILFTGFNGHNNPSKVIVVRTNHDKLLFNNSYKEIDNQLVNSNVEEYDYSGNKEKREQKCARFYCLEIATCVR